MPHSPRGVAFGSIEPQRKADDRLCDLLARNKLTHQTHGFWQAGVLDCTKRCGDEHLGLGDGQARTDSPEIDAKASHWYGVERRPLFGKLTPRQPALWSRNERTGW